MWYIPPLSIFLSLSVAAIISKAYTHVSLRLIAMNQSLDIDRHLILSVATSGKS